MKKIERKHEIILINHTPYRQRYVYNFINSRLKEEIKRSTKIPTVQTAYKWVALSLYNCGAT